jgi:hypothetical protein
VLDGDAPRVVDAVEQQRGAVGGEVLVDCPARAVPVPVVVDDEDAAVGEHGVEMLELVLGRRVPVGVESQQRERARRVAGDRLLHRPAHEVQAPGGIAGGEQRLAHALLVEMLGVEELAPGARVAGAGLLPRLECRRVEC